LADVSADGRADAVIYFQETGTWYVAKADADGFGFDDTPDPWIGRHGVGSQDQLLADVTGDGRADAIVFFDATGRWYVAKAKTTNNGFHPPTLWISGHGYTSDRRFAGDVNGDLKADAVVYGWNGSWHVALSNGVNGFGTPSQWAAGHGAGSDNQMLADATGGGRADAVVYFKAGPIAVGSWYVAPAIGSQFTVPAPTYPWKNRLWPRVIACFLAQHPIDGLASHVIRMSASPNSGR
jgi:hypothetical protein